MRLHIDVQPFGHPRHGQVLVFDGPSQAQPINNPFTVLPNVRTPLSFGGVLT